MLRIRSWGLVLGGVLAGFVFAFAWTLEAQTTTVEFAVDNNTANDILTGTTGDRVIFIGKSNATEPVGDCASGDRPVQTVVATDPSDGKPARIITVYYTSGTSPASNGTRVTNLVSQGQCNGGTLTKFKGDAS